MDLRNVTLNNDKWPSVIPSGLYKLNMNFTFENILFFSVTFNIDIVSDIKTSFWWTVKPWLNLIHLFGLIYYLEMTTEYLAPAFSHVFICLLFLSINT